MDVLYSAGRATVAEIRDRIPSPPSYSAVRAMLRVLEDKGQIRHLQDGATYVYLPTMSAEKAKRSAITHLLSTFFGGKAGDAMAALINVSRDQLTDGELETISRMIEAAKKEGR